MKDLKTYQAALERAIRAGETRAHFEAFMAAGGAQRIHFVIDGDDAAAKAINQVWANRKGFTYILKHTLEALIAVESRVLSDFQTQVTADSLVPDMPPEPAKDYVEAAE